MTAKYEPCAEWERQKTDEVWRAGRMYRYHGGHDLWSKHRWIPLVDGRGPFLQIDPQGKVKYQPIGVATGNMWSSQPLDDEHKLMVVRWQIQIAAGLPEE